MLVHLVENAKDGRHPGSPVTFGFGITPEAQHTPLGLREGGGEGGQVFLAAHDPARLWEFYLQLTEVEQAFKEFKGDLALRPIHHQLAARIEAHLFVLFPAYCFQVTLKARLRRTASGLTPRAVLEKFAAVQMIDVHLPTTDGHEIVMARHTQPENDIQLLLDQL